MTIVDKVIISGKRFIHKIPVSQVGGSSHSWIVNGGKLTHTLCGTLASDLSRCITWQLEKYFVRY